MAKMVVLHVINCCSLSLSDVTGPVNNFQTVYGPYGPYYGRVPGAECLNLKFRHPDGNTLAERSMGS